jgi:hypothetical protein
MRARKAIFLLLAFAICGGTQQARGQTPAAPAIILAQPSLYSGMDDPSLATSALRVLVNDCLAPQINDPAMKALSAWWLVSASSLPGMDAVFTPAASEDTALAERAADAYDTILMRRCRAPLMKAIAQDGPAALSHALVSINNAAAPKTPGMTRFMDEEMERLKPALVQRYMPQLKKKWGGIPASQHPTYTKDEVSACLARAQNDRNRIAALQMAVVQASDAMRKREPGFVARYVRASDPSKAVANFLEAHFGSIFEQCGDQFLFGMHSMTPEEAGRMNQEVLVTDLKSLASRANANDNLHAAFTARLAKTELGRLIRQMETGATPTPPPAPAPTPSLAPAQPPPQTTQAPAAPAIILAQSFLYSDIDDPSLATSALRVLVNDCLAPQINDPAMKALSAWWLVSASNFPGMDTVFTPAASADTALAERAADAYDTILMRRCRAPLMNAIALDGPAALSHVLVIINNAAAPKTQGMTRSLDEEMERLGPTLVQRYIASAKKKWESIPANQRPAYTKNDVSACVARIRSDRSSIAMMQWSVVYFSRVIEKKDPNFVTKYVRTLDFSKAITNFIEALWGPVFEQCGDQIASVIHSMTYEEAERLQQRTSMSDLKSLASRANANDNLHAAFTARLAKTELGRLIRQMETGAAPTPPPVPAQPPPQTAQAPAAKTPPALAISDAVLGAAQTKCAQLGFKKGSEKFGDCVLTLAK